MTIGATFTPSANLLAFRASASLTEAVLCEELEAAARTGINSALPVMEHAVERGAGMPVLRAGVAFLVRRFGAEAVAVALRPLSKFIPGIGTVVEIGLLLEGEPAAADEGAAVRNRQRNTRVKTGLEQLFSNDPTVAAKGAGLLRAWGVPDAEIRRMRETGKVPDGYAFLVPHLRTRPHPVARTVPQPPAAPTQTAWRPPRPPELAPTRRTPKPTARQRPLQSRQMQEALHEPPSQRAAVLDRGASALRSRLDERIRDLGVTDPSRADPAQRAAAIADLGEKLSLLKAWWASHSPTAEAIDLSLFGGAAFHLRPADLRQAIDRLEAVVVGLQHAQEADGSSLGSIRSGSVGKSPGPVVPEIRLPGKHATPGGQAAADENRRRHRVETEKGLAAWKDYNHLLRLGHVSEAEALRDGLSPIARMAFDREASRRALPGRAVAAYRSQPGISTQRGNELLQGITRTGPNAASGVAERIARASTLDDLRSIQAVLPRALRNAPEVVEAAAAFSRRVAEPGWSAIVAEALRLTGGGNLPGQIEDHLRRRFHASTEEAHRALGMAIRFKNADLAAMKALTRQVAATGVLSASQLSQMRHLDRTIPPNETSWLEPLVAAALAHRRLGSFKDLKTDWTIVGIAVRRGYKFTDPTFHGEIKIYSQRDAARS